MSDVDVIATYSEWADEYDRLTAADWSFANDQRKAELAETLHDHAGDFTDAALREIDRLRARAAAYDALREVCEDVPDMLEQLSEYLWVSEDDPSLQYTMHDDHAMAKAAAIRAALASAERDGAGTDAGDATAGDGGAE